MWCVCGTIDWRREGGRGEGGGGGRDKGSSANIDHLQPHQSWKHLAGCDKKRGSWDFGIPGKDIM